MPTLRLGFVPFWQSGRRGGEVVIDLPGAATLPHQQLPVLPGKSSHQKSTPFGCDDPSGATPIRFPVNELRYEVDTLVVSHPGTGVVEPMTGPHTVASGAANSMMPRR